MEDITVLVYISLDHERTACPNGGVHKLNMTRTEDGKLVSLGVALYHIFNKMYNIFTYKSSRDNESNNHV